MLVSELIGHLGADAEIRTKDGNSFATCRVAHTDKWKDLAGVTHESTTWVDVILPADSKVIPFLKKGTMIFVRGTQTTRVYSSAADKCYKAGVTIRMKEIQLLSKREDESQSKQPADDQQEKGTIAQMVEQNLQTKQEKSEDDLPF